MSSYRRDIDGMRAVAVSIVVLFHAHIPGFSGGFVGVDVFFVLSGFLITGIIVKDIEAGRFSVLRFFERRARRILPAVFTMAAVSTVVAAVIFIPPDLVDLGWELSSAAIYASNIYYWQTAGYFAGPAESKLLLHTWSLSVEEQFYFITPFVLMAAGRWFRGRFVAALLPFAVVSLALSVWGVSGAPTFTFYMLPTRFWELLVGSFLALGVAPPLRTRATNEAVGFAGLAMIALSTLLFTADTPFPGIAALVPTLGTAAMLHAGRGGGTLLTRLLSLRPLVLIGLISYSLYLWHWPVLVLGRYAAFRALTLPESIGLIALSGVLAALSYRFVEQPFRTPPSHGFSGAGPFVAAGAAMGAAVVLGGLLVITDGLPIRYPGFTAENIPGKEEYREGTCFLRRDQTAEDWTEADCALTRGPRRILLWGDSHAAHYAPGLSRSSAVEATIVEHAASACPPVRGLIRSSRPLCSGVNEHAWELLSGGGYDGVVLAARWESLTDEELAMLTDTLDDLGELGLEVTVIGASPIFDNDPQAMLARSAVSPDVVARAHSDVARRTNERLRPLVGSAAFVDPAAVFCEGDMCSYRRDGEYLFRDPGHFSVVGSAFAVEQYFPYVRR
ncbi:MAG: acyltransferase family protein [Myxococcota bacterium]